MVGATKLASDRERSIARLCNGEAPSDADYSLFTCPRDALLTLVNIIKEKTTGVATAYGGLNKHYDLTFGSTRAELKVSKKTTQKEVLELTPWQDGVQFLQGQTKSKKGQLFMDDGHMIAAWFNEEIVPFVAAEFPEASQMTLKSYRHVMFGLKVTKAQSTTPAGKFITWLRENQYKDPHKRLQARWLAFEDRWLPTHPLNHSALEAHIRNFIEQKDIWININKEGVCVIEGSSVIGLDYIGCFPKKEGGSCFKYTLRLQKKSGGEIRDVPIVFKLTWRNGGQAVQNLNFQIG